MATESGSPALEPAVVKALVGTAVAAAALWWYRSQQAAPSVPAATGSTASGQSPMSAGRRPSDPKSQSGDAQHAHPSHDGPGPAGLVRRSVTPTASTAPDPDDVGPAADAAPGAAAAGSVAEKAQTLHDAGLAAFSAGSFSEAAEKFTAAIALEATPARYNNRAMCHLKLDRNNSAINDCKESLRLGGTVGRQAVKSLCRMGSAYLALEVPQQAFWYFQQAGRLAPEDEGIKALHAKACAEMEEKQRRLAQQASGDMSGFGSNCLHDAPPPSQYSNHAAILMPLLMPGSNTLDASVTAVQICDERLPNGKPDRRPIGKMLLSFATDAVINEDWGQARLFYFVGLFLITAADVHDQDLLVPMRRRPHKKNESAAVAAFYAEIDAATENNASLRAALKRLVNCPCWR